MRLRGKLRGRVRKTTGTDGVTCLCFFVGAREHGKLADRTRKGRMAKGEGSPIGQRVRPVTGGTEEKTLEFAFVASIAA